MSDLAGLDKEFARKQFTEKTKELDLVHSFSFDEAWSFVEYKKVVTGVTTPHEVLPANYSKDAFRAFISDVELKIKESEKGVSGDAVSSMNPLRHSFAKGQYIREVYNPAGALVVTKIHKHDHPFFLMKGDMSIMSEDGEKRLIAPHYGITTAGTKRMIFCHTECVFVTVHATTKTDIKEIEEELILTSFDEMESNQKNGGDL
jgi:hypothetical protein